MSEKRYAVNVSIILGISASAVLMLFFVFLVAHHRDIPDRVQQHRGALVSSGSSVAERIKPVGQVVVASAETQREPVQVVADAPAVVNGQKVYESACVACHGTGIAGAPKVGNAGLWVKRIAKGVDTLYASAINGVQGSAGVMPAKGGNAALSNAEVKAAVDYIVAHSK